MSQKNGFLPSLISDTQSSSVLFFIRGKDVWVMEMPATEVCFGPSLPPVFVSKAITVWP